MSKPSTPSEFSLDYLDQLDWPSAAPTGAEVLAIPGEPKLHAQSSAHSLLPARPTTGSATASPPPLSPSMATPATTAYESLTRELDTLQSGLRSTRNQVRQIAADLDSASRSMADTIGCHRTALRAAISLAQDQCERDLKRARKAVLMALAAPCLIVAMLALSISTCAALWAAHQVTTARADLAQLEARTQQLTEAFCRTPAGRSACRPRDVASGAN